MPERRLSVIIPVYKVEQYLDRCLESIVNQTYRNLEIILVDDGSPDSCPEKCDVWAARDDRIKVIHKENGGLSSARNAGLDVMTGELVTFVDSDDFIKPTMYADMLRCLEDTESDIVCCGRIIKSYDLEEEQLTCNSKEVYTSAEAMRQLLIKRSMDEAAWDKIYFSKLFENIRFPVGVTNEDIIVILDVIKNSNRVCHAGKAYYYYWKNPHGITKSHYGAMSIVVEHMQYVDEFVNKNYPELHKEEKCFQARYAIDMLENMIGSKGAIEEYPGDYDFYMTALRKNFGSILPFHSSYITVKFKLKGALLLLGLYAPIKRVVKGKV